MILSAPSPFGHSPYLICDEQRERIESITLSRFIPSELCGVFSSSPAVSRSITGCFATAKYRGGVRRTEGLNKIIRNRGNISKYQHPPSVHRRWDRGSARRARGLSLQKHNTLSFSILRRRDRTVAIVKNFIAKIHVYSFWFSAEPNTEPTCDKCRRRIRGSLILLRLQVSFLFFI